MYFFLKLKAWQLFVLIVIPMMVAPFETIGSFIYLIGYVLYFMWVYAIGSGINDIVPKPLKSNTLYFKSCTIFLMLSSFIGYSDFQIKNLFQYFLFTILAFAAFIYVLIFACRTLETAIQGEKVGFFDYIKAFGFMWIFPVGLWYIQPAVKRVLDHYEAKNKD